MWCCVDERDLADKSYCGLPRKRDLFATRATTIHNKYHNSSLTGLHAMAHASEPQTKLRFLFQNTLDRFNYSFDTFGPQVRFKPSVSIAGGNSISPSSFKHPCWAEQAKCLPTPCTPWVFSCLKICLIKVFRLSWCAFCVVSSLATYNCHSTYYDVKYSGERRIE